MSCGNVAVLDSSSVVLRAVSVPVEDGFKDGFVEICVIASVGGDEVGAWVESTVESAQSQNTSS